MILESALKGHMEINFINNLKTTTIKNWKEIKRLEYNWIGWGKYQTIGQKTITMKP